MRQIDRQRKAKGFLRQASTGKHVSLERAGENRGSSLGRDRHASLQSVAVRKRDSFARLRGESKPMTIPVYEGKMPSLTTDQLIEVDRAMMQDMRIELIQMMENAGALPKAGLLAPEAQALVGELYLANIGVPHFSIPSQLCHCTLGRCSPSVRFCALTRPILSVAS